MPVRTEAAKITGVFYETPDKLRSLAFHIHVGGYGPRPVIRATNAKRVITEFAPTMSELKALHAELGNLIASAG